MPTDPLLVSVQEAADALGIGLTKCKELVKTGRIRTVRIDRRVLVPVEALGEYVEGLK